MSIEIKPVTPEDYPWVMDFLEYVAHSRSLKPEIPLLGNDGIPLREEIYFEYAEWCL